MSPNRTVYAQGSVQQGYTRPPPQQSALNFFENVN
jgi:hypothetical protein